MAAWPDCTSASALVHARQADVAASWPLGSLAPVGMGSGRAMPAPAPAPMPAAAELTAREPKPLLPELLPSAPDAEEDDTATEAAPADESARWPKPKLSCSGTAAAADTGARRSEAGAKADDDAGAVEAAGRTGAAEGAGVDSAEQRETVEPADEDRAEDVSGEHADTLRIIASPLLLLLTAVAIVAVETDDDDEEDDDAVLLAGAARTALLLLLSAGARPSSRGVSVLSGANNEPSQLPKPPAAGPEGKPALAAPALETLTLALAPHSGEAGMPMPKAVSPMPLMPPMLKPFMLMPKDDTAEVRGAEAGSVAEAPSGSAAGKMPEAAVAAAVEEDDAAGPSGRGMACMGGTDGPGPAGNSSAAALAAATAAAALLLLRWPCALPAPAAAAQASPVWMSCSRS